MTSNQLTDSPPNVDDELNGDEHVLPFPEEEKEVDAPASISSLLRSAFSSPNQITAMLSNYSTSFNAVNVGIVLPVLKYSLSTSMHHVSPVYDTLADEQTIQRSFIEDDKQSDEQDSIVASSLLAGMIFGQMLGGYLGDALGRR